jgi:hypothetical protein
MFLLKVFSLNIEDQSMCSKVFGYYPSSCLYLKCSSVSFSKQNVSETGFCLRLQVKPTQLDPIDRVNQDDG